MLQNDSYQHSLEPQRPISITGHIPHYLITCDIETGYGLMRKFIIDTLALFSRMRTLVRGPNIRRIDRHGSYPQKRSVQSSQYKIFGPDHPATLIRTPGPLSGRLHRPPYRPLAVFVGSALGRNGAHRLTGHRRSHFHS